jgi:hypothetical protein
MIVYHICLELGANCSLGIAVWAGEETDQENRA